MMKKKLLLLFVLLTTMTAAVCAQSIGVFTADNSGPYTNVRESPKGKVVDRIPTADTAMISVANPTNGWWQIISDEYDVGDYQTKFKGSTTGSYWIHYSVLACHTRNYGGQTLYLRKSPSDKAPAVFKFNDYTLLRPMEIKGDWVKVKTTDGKHTGWIEFDWLCGNSLTNCC